MMIRAQKPRRTRHVSDTILAVKTINIFLKENDKPFNQIRLFLMVIPVYLQRVEEFASMHTNPYAVD